MGRPSNMIVVNRGVVLSVQPKVLKTYLEAMSKGSPAELSGKLIGTIFGDFSTLTPDMAKKLLITLSPEDTTPNTGTATDSTDFFPGETPARDDRLTA